MKSRVLVIDDELITRRDGYEKLAKRVGELVPGLEVEMDFVEHPEELAVKLSAGGYSAALVDAVLELNWGREFSLGPILHALGDNIPIALVSTRWDATNAAPINMAWEKRNCRMFLHWRDIADSQEGNVRYAVAQLSKLVAIKEKIQLQLNLKPDDPIRILHVSDLQMGGFDDKRIKLEAHQSAEEILAHCDGAPTFIAFTGDIAERGRPREYDKARQWLEHFRLRLGFPELPTNRLLLVPGNHDVTLGLGCAGRAVLKQGRGKKGIASLTFEPTGDQDSDLLAFAYRPYLDFAAGVTDCPWLERDHYDQGLAWVEARHRHLGVVFYGINTAGPANPCGLPGQTVNADSLAKIKTCLATVIGPAEQAPVVIGLGHHCPLSGASEGGIANIDDFATFLNGKIRTALFLHGHAHKQRVSYTAEKFRLVRSSASTLAKGAMARPEDTLRGFNLLELQRKDGVVTGMEAMSLAWVGESLQRVDGSSTFVRAREGMFMEAIS
jgi:hypothetical protein